MAGDWIKMNKSLARDPRVVRISSALNADRLRTVGGLFSVWCLADELTSDGMLDAYTPELLDEIAGLPGISHAMASVGWLVIGDGFLEFPRFERHNGQSSKRRAQEAVRKMSARNADKCPKESQTKCGPEKRREEVLIDNDKNACASVRRPTLSEALSAASMMGVTPEKAEEWWNCREASEWMKGMAGGGTSPVGTNWQADLKTYASRQMSQKQLFTTDHRAEKAKREYTEPPIKIKML